MKTNNDLLIYDGTCPLCSGYSAAFVKHGLLQGDGRASFSELEDQSLIGLIDSERARHEIPLIDRSTKTVYYGLDALIRILSRRAPALSVITKNLFLRKLFGLLYAFISYNRRVIIPAPKTSCSLDCTPRFKASYRSAFIAFAVLFSAWITWLFGEQAGPLVDDQDGGFHMLLIAGTGWVFQAVIALVFFRKIFIDYLSQLAVLMIIGVLLLVPSIIFSKVFPDAAAIILAAGVALSSSVMLWQHIKRTRTLGFSQLTTISWLLALQGTAWFWIYELKLI
jgi:predicted DCC family thiol-disulfide oxidoreductase YuxK